MKKDHPVSESGFFNLRIFSAFVLCSIGASLGIFSWASTPATDSITVPSTIGQTVTVTWTGTIPPGSNPASSCVTVADTPLSDQHVSTVIVPAGVYSTLAAKFTFKITWTPVVNINSSDEILTVIAPDSSIVGSSDGGITNETVAATNLAAGAHQNVACGFANAQPQPCTGPLTHRTVEPAGAAPADH